MLCIASPPFGISERYNETRGSVYMTIQVAEKSPYWKLLIVGHNQTVTCGEFCAQIDSAHAAKQINSSEFDELHDRHTRLCEHRKPTDKLNT